LRFRSGIGEGLALPMLLLAAALPVRSQVERVSLTTTGISCGVCAAVSELHFRRMPGVESVAISLAKESIVIVYKPTANFSARGIKEVLQPLDVGILLFRISARGHIQEEGGKMFFIAGNDKFVVPPSGNSQSLLRAATVRIEGVVNDRADPVELKIISITAIKP